MRSAAHVGHRVGTFGILIATWAAAHLFAAQAAAQAAASETTPGVSAHEPVAAARAHDRSSHPTRAHSERILRLLSGLEALPDAQVFLAGGGATASALIDIQANVAQPTYVRVRALRALSFFGAQLAEPTLRSVLDDVQARPVFVREAAFGLVQCIGAGAIDALAALLTRPAASVRVAAIEALTSLGTDAARQHVLRQRDRESDASVRRALDAALDAAQMR